MSTDDQGAKNAPKPDAEAGPRARRRPGTGPKGLVYGIRRCLSTTRRFFFPCRARRPPEHVREPPLPPPPPVGTTDLWHGLTRPRYGPRIAHGCGPTPSGRRFSQPPYGARGLAPIQTPPWP